MKGILQLHFISSSYPTTTSSLASSPAVMAWTGGGDDVTADGGKDTGTAKETRDEEDDLSIV